MNNISSIFDGIILFNKDRVKVVKLIFISKDIRVFMEIIEKMWLKNK